MANINIGGVETFSTVDFPNQIAAAVFMQGCPWRCPFCYNTHLQEAGKTTDFVWEKFIEFLHKRKKVLTGVAFSGGEPLMQDGLLDAILEVKAMGYKIGVHTGGYRPEALAKILPHIDWVGLDIKTPFEDDRYKLGTGGANHLENVIKSLDMIIKSGIEFETRTTCDPRLLDVEDIYKIAASLKSKGVDNYNLQRYRPIPCDNVSTELDCDKFFIDKKLIDYLNNTFSTVEFRK